MKIMKQLRFLIAAATLISFSQAQAVELLKKDDASFNLGGRFQLFGVGQRVIDPYKDNNRVFLFLKQARINASGTFEDYKYYTEWAMGGEEAVKNLNSSVSLMDMRADVPLTQSQYVRIGQFKVATGREALTNDGSLSFTARSINDMVGMLGRDVGMAYVYQEQGYMGTFGVFTGGGRDNPERYLPEELGMPLLAMRIGYDSAGEDPYYYNLSNDKNFTESVSAFLNVAYMMDSRVGHSTVLNVKSVDKSLLLNPNWNPYLTSASAAANVGRSTVKQMSFDAQKRFVFAGYNTTAEIEYTHSEFKNDNGGLQVNGGRLQGTMMMNPFEVAARYAVVYPSKDFKYKYTSSPYTQYNLTGEDPFYEVSTSVSFFHRPWSKFTLEATFHMNSPVVVEPNVGAYLLAEQPDQVTVIRTGYLERQFVPEAKFMYQLTF